MSPQQSGEFQYLRVQEYSDSNSSLSTRDGHAFIPTQLRRASSGAWFAIKELLVALLLVSSHGTPTMAQERTHTGVTRAQPNVIVGRQIAAPPWSAACMTDHGLSECGEPMWIYGSRSEIARYRNAF